MALHHVVGICFCLVITSEIAFGQSNVPGPDEPARTVVQRTYDAANLTPWRRVETRSESGDRVVVVETVEVPDIDGRVAPTQRVVTETIRTTPNIVQITRDMFDYDQDRRPILVETTESLRETLANGDTRATHDTSNTDLDGHVSLTARQTEQTRSGAGVREILSMLVVPDFNQPFRAVERSEYTERAVSPGVVRSDSTVEILDVNGRWQVIEARGGESREVSASDRVEEETYERLDKDVKLAVDARSVTRRSTVNGRMQEIIETFTRYEPGSDRFVLNARVHRTTSTTDDGGSSTVEDVEERNAVAPSDPLRLIRRIVTTDRRVDNDRRVTQRQVFERDVNGRMRLVVEETEDRTAE
jgi:hypothetical protein